MFKHVLVRADDRQSLLSEFIPNQSNIKFFKPKVEFTDRYSALAYLENKLTELRKYSALAVQVSLPTTHTYNRTLLKYESLIDRLERTPSSWYKLRQRIETQLVDLSSKLRQLEQSEQGPRNTCWVVYWNETIDQSPIRSDNHLESLNS
jgi:hypothetical protein